MTSNFCLVSDAVKKISAVFGPDRESWLALTVTAFLLAGVSPARAQYAYAVLHAFEDPPRYPSATLVKGSDGALYGTTPQGGTSTYGTVFRMSQDGSEFAILHNFDRTEGAYPAAALASMGGVLYGTTSLGGTFDYGTVFKIGEDGSGFTLLHSFNNTDGANPYGAVVNSGGVLYGTAVSGGTSNRGTVFKVGEDGSGFAILHNFSQTDGANPFGGLVSSGDVLYGTTVNGGTSSVLTDTGYLTIGVGTVFKIGEDGTGFTVLHSFTGTDGANPYGALIHANGVLYGTAVGGGPSNYGNIFRIGEDGSGFTILRNFDNTSPRGALVRSGGVLYGTAVSGATAVGGNVFKIGEDGSAFTIVHNFNMIDGRSPSSGVIHSGGFLYGTTEGGGRSGLVSDSYGGYGTVFRVSVGGAGFAILHNFNQTSGAYPRAALVSSGGVLHGTTPEGGTSGLGTVFKVREDGTGFSVLHNFNQTTGASPQAALLRSGGWLFGTTVHGGTSDHGTVFTISEDGSGFAVLHNFDNTNGALPFGGLVSSGGVLYGTTVTGGTFNGGTVFRIGEDGSGFTILRHFDFNPTDGALPFGGLVSSGGVLYGTTTSGGSTSRGFFDRGDGTVFKIGADGSGFTILHSFDSKYSLNGAYPRAALVSSGGVLYGTTQGGGGGGNGHGTVFKIGKDGSGFRILHHFNMTNGFTPQSALVLSGGMLFGTAIAPESGQSGYGNVFRIGQDGSGFTILHRFNNANGSFPHAGLVSSGDALYGAAAQGGPSGGGVVFRLARNPVVVNPNGGERLFVHSSYRIEWTAPEIVALGGFDVFASLDDGASFDPIPGCTGLDGNARSCTWLSPGPATRMGRIRVVAHDGIGNAATAVSSSSFRIVADQPFVGLDAPNTALTWKVGGLGPIRWSHNLGRDSAVDIELSRNGGTTWSLLAAGIRNATATTGQFNWVVSGPATRTALVRVSSSSSPGVSDISNTTFAITSPFLTVTSPVAGVRWRPDQMKLITWNHNLGRPARVNIEISRDGGGTWQTVGVSRPSSGETTGSFSWLVTGPTTANAMIRVSSAANLAVNDSSELFGIQSGPRTQ